MANLWVKKSIESIQAEAALGEEQGGFKRTLTAVNLMALGIGAIIGAGFFVLVGARMPAVLIESSFISNVVEEGYLGRVDYRSRIVDAIVNGLKAYRDGK